MVPKAKRKVKPPGKVRSRMRNRFPLYKPRGNDDLQQFKLALRDPFNPRANGARVPDSYCFPTVTYHYRTSMQLVSDAQGLINFAVFPSPALTAAIGQGSVPNGATAFTANNQVFYLVNPTELVSKLTEYRVVAWGVRILAKDTAFAAKGKIMVAMVPTTANAPSWNTLQTASATDTGVVTEYIAGFNINYLSVSILNLPAVKTYSMQDLLHADIEVSGMPLNESFYDFRGTADRSATAWSGTTVLGDEMVATGTALTNATTLGRKDVASVRGGVAVLISAVGCPVTTQAFDVEVVYHLEGTPNISSAAGGVSGLIPSAQAVVNGSTVLVDKALHDARSRGPPIRQTDRARGGTRAVRFEG